MKFDFLNKDDTKELDNLAKNIIIKKSQMGISLKEISNLSKVNYSILTKLINKEPVMPSLSSLKKLAEFFKLEVADLLKNGNLPQYIPKFSDFEYEQILNYINDEEFNCNLMEFSDSFINHKAFAIDFSLELLDKLSKITFLFSTSNQIELGKYYFVKLVSLNRYCLIEVINEFKDKVLVKLIDIKNINKCKTMELDLKLIKILGVLVKQKLSIKM